MSHPLVYEINTRCWLPELARESGRRLTLASVPDAEVARWAALGFTHIWLMGVWETGPLARQAARDNPAVVQACLEALPDLRDEDIAGSPYAIAGYQVPRALGGERGLQRFRKQLHKHGLGLLLDFIPNHLGLDHPWIQSHPERFVRADAAVPGTIALETPHGTRHFAHGRDPYFPPWTDTVQLDFRLADTRAAVQRELASVAGRCDGVRCDMAMLVLNDVFARTWAGFPSAGPEPAREFWGEATATIRRDHPEFLFLAEAYWGLEPRLLHLGFDHAYDKTLYDRLIARDPAGAQRHLLGLDPGALAGGAHFLENHDEIRIASHVSPTEHAADALLILGLPGLRLLHDGQLRGACLRTPVHLGRRWPEAVQTRLEALYATLLTACRQSAVGTGEPRLLRPRAAWWDNPSHETVIAVQWQVLPPAFDLVLVNLAPHPSQAYLPLALPGLEARSWVFTDRLGDQRHERLGEDLVNQGFYVDLAPHATHLFHVEPRA